MNIKRAFTLIELLIVISIISMLSSIILATTTTVKAKGRDAQRIQQVRQIDLALRLYIEANGHAPYLNSVCQITSPTPPSSLPSACIAVSTSALAGNPNWTAFVSELTSGGFITTLPNDPCGTSCISASSFPIGYTYVAPLAMQYFCSQPGTLCTANNSSYQMYAPLEQSVTPVGSDGASTSYFSSPGVTAPSGLSVTYTLTGTPNAGATFSWNASNTSFPGQNISKYKMFLIPGDHEVKVSIGNSTSINKTYAGWESPTLINPLIPPFCLEIQAIDTGGNVSAYSTPLCITAWP